MALFYIYISMKEPLQLKISPSSTICLIPLRQLSQEEDKNSSHLCHEKREPVQKKTWSLPCWVKCPHKEVDFSLTCGTEIRGLLSRMRVGKCQCFPGSTDGKAFSCNAGELGSIPVLSLHAFIQASTEHLYGRHGAGHSGSRQEQHRSPVLEDPRRPH